MSGIINAVAAQLHVTLSGDRAGAYIIEEQPSDGVPVLVPDTGIAAIRRRHGPTLAEFEEEYGLIRPPDGEA